MTDREFYNSFEQKQQDYLMMAKYLEKVGDHAVNIAQWAIFRMTGDMEGVKLY